MVESAKRAFGRYGRSRVVPVGEFNTSKTCHVCGDVLQGIVDVEKNMKKGAFPGAVDIGIKRCARR